MPQLSRVSNISNDVKIKKLGDANISITPVPTGYASPLINIKSTSGVLTLFGGTYNLTPNTTFTANVLIWGAGGGSSTGNGGAGGFSSATMRFTANVSYNVVVGRGGTSGGGGGGSGIEYIANSVPIIVAGGGGGGGAAGNGGAGGGLVAASGTPGIRATAYGASSPGSLRVGGPSASAVGFGAGGAGPGGGGGGLYGGASGSPGGGGGGGAFIESAELLNANTQTGTNTIPFFSNYSGRGSAGNGGTGNASGNDGLIVINLL